MSQILIGIDGGATKINAWQVEITKKKSFMLGTIHAEMAYSSIPGYIENFTPVSLGEQLDDFRKGEFHLTNSEIQQGAVLIETCAQVIEDITQQSKNKNIVVGIGMPGLKTKEGKGIAVIANGPRMPHYIKNLEERLSMGKINFVEPIKRLGSDADYCGIGENYAENGLFRDVQNAYYIGLGTGAADALKLNGCLLPFDQTKNWLAKTWEMKNNDGVSLESIVSARGFQQLYAQISKTTTAELNKQNVFADTIIERSQNGENNAQQTCRIYLDVLSDLLLERITTLYKGWQNNFSFVNTERNTLEENHPYKGSFFERIIIGQRIGSLMKSEIGAIQLKEPLMHLLIQKIEQSPHLSKSAKRHYADLERFIAFSNLRAAPALGAAVDAMVYGEDNA